MDVIIQYYLQNVVLPIKSKSKYVNVHSISPHYFRKLEDYDNVMLNNAWLLNSLFDVVAITIVVLKYAPW